MYSQQLSKQQLKGLSIVGSLPYIASNNEKHLAVIDNGTKLPQLFLHHYTTV